MKVSSISNNYIAPKRNHQPLKVQTFGAEKQENNSNKNNIGKGIAIGVIVSAGVIFSIAALKEGKFTKNLKDMFSIGSKNSEKIKPEFINQPEEGLLRIKGFRYEEPIMLPKDPELKNRAIEKFREQKKIVDKKFDRTVPEDVAQYFKTYGSGEWITKDGNKSYNFSNGDIYEIYCYDPETQITKVEKYALQKLKLIFSNEKDKSYSKVVEKGELLDSSYYEGKEVGHIKIPIFSENNEYMRANGYTRYDIYAYKNSDEIKKSTGFVNFDKFDPKEFDKKIKRFSPEPSMFAKTEEIQVGNTKYESENGKVLKMIFYDPYTNISKVEKYATGETRLVFKNLNDSKVKTITKIYKPGEVIDETYYIGNLLEKQDDFNILNMPKLSMLSKYMEENNFTSCSTYNIK